MSQTILFVCTGNTCRSPMAQICANEYFGNSCMDMTAMSCGLAAEPGDILSHTAYEALKKRYGKEYSHKARQIDEELVRKSDIIVGMTATHTEMIKRLFPDMLKGKVVISMPRNIPDPYGGSPEVYKNCLFAIEDGIRELFCPPRIDRFDGFEIRNFENRHAKEVYETEKLCFSTPWTADSFETLVIKPYAKAVVATVGSRVAGFAVVYIIAGEAELLDIAVHPDFRKKGIGRALLDRAVEDAEAAGASKMLLEVRVSNTDAINLYRKKGFEKVGERKDYYAHPTENAGLYDLKLC